VSAAAAVQGDGALAGLRVVECGDGGYITAGELSADGLRVLGYSRAVRFGTLGVCPEY